MKKFISRMFNNLPKRLAAGAIVALAIALPVAASAADMVKMEAQTTVANATLSAGTMNWGPSTAATYNQVVAVQVAYDNDEDAGSGKTTNNLHVKINIPTTPGTSQAITSKVTSDNSTTINGSANVTLDSANEYLQYIPGTATWKHAVSDFGPQTAISTVSDAVVTDPNGVNLGTENPCQSGSIVIQARVMTPGVQVTKEVRNLTTGATWATSNTAQPGETIQYRISYQNTGNTEENQVIIRDNLPANTTLVPGTTYLVNQTNPNGILSSSDDIAQGGIFVGNYAPTANAYVIFEVKMPTADQLSCGVNTLTNVGVAQPQGMEEYYNEAVTTITKTCANTPTYSCDAFDVTTSANRTVTVSNFKFTASNGGTLTSAVINWGDNSTPLTTNTVLNQAHSFAQDGTYTISLSGFKVGGQAVTASGNCSKSVTFGPAPPTVLVNTGAGDVIGIFGASVVVAAFAHRLFLSRKLSRN